LKRAMKHSICYGVFKDGEQIGFARVVTDYAVMAYLGDVFILEKYRGMGLSKWLMKIITEYPYTKNIRRMILATKDAHGLYKQTGFTSVEFPDRWMERVNNKIYKNGGWVE
jgi:GNAT superfamily N-acetyltransferase